jgi:hypothetical protein
VQSDTNFLAKSDIFLFGAVVFLRPPTCQVVRKRNGIGEATRCAGVLITVALV